MDAFFFRVVFFFATLLQASIQDRRTLHISRDRLLLASAILVLLDSDTSYCALIGRLFGWLYGFSTVIATRWVTRGRMGLGDAWATGLIGAFGGPRLVFAATLDSALLFIPAKRRVKYPVVPALLLASIHSFAFFSH